MKTIVVSEKQASLRDKVLVLKEKKSLSGAELARITGRSEGTISDLLSGRKAFSDKLLGLIHESLRDYLGETELVETRQLTRMWTIARTAKQESDMRLVVGNTGIGKSVVFRKFAEENGHTCYYKIYNPRMTWYQFLGEVCRGFGIKMPKQKRYYTRHLLEALTSWVEENAAHNPMLIVDESEVMRSGFFKEFKNLRTATDNLLAIVVVGITDVSAKIARLAGLDPGTWQPVREDSNQFTTFARRIKHFRIPNISTEDVRDWCLHVGITSEKVIALAARKWWNYEEASRALRRARAMQIELGSISPEEFELL